MERKISISMNQGNDKSISKLIPQVSISMRSNTIWLRRRLLVRSWKIYMSNFILYCLCKLASHSNIKNIINSQLNVLKYMLVIYLLLGQFKCILFIYLLIYSFRYASSKDLCQLLMADLFLRIACFWNLCHSKSIFVF